MRSQGTPFSPSLTLVFHFWTFPSCRDFLVRRVTVSFEKWLFGPCLFMDLFFRPVRFVLSFQRDRPIGSCAPLILFFSFFKSPFVPPRVSVFHRCSSSLFLGFFFSSVRHSCPTTPPNTPKKTQQKHPPPPQNPPPKKTAFPPSSSPHFPFATGSLCYPNCWRLFLK